MLILFMRKVIPDTSNPTLGKVEARVKLLADSDLVELGVLKFPSKQTWTKFYGAISKGALGIQDLDVEMENVPNASPNQETPTADEAKVPTKPIQPLPPPIHGKEGK